MSQYVCEVEGCERGPMTGWALHRVSPKGERFRGRCGKHFQGQVDPIVQVIEDSNHPR